MDRLTSPLLRQATPLSAAGVFGLRLRQALVDQMLLAQFAQFAEHDVSRVSSVKIKYYEVGHTGHSYS